MKKRLIALVLALIMCLYLMPSALAADNLKPSVRLFVTIRDFNADGLLFEGRGNAMKELAAPVLGADHKPVFDLAKWQQLDGPNVTQAHLDALFNDTPGVNLSAQKTITLKNQGGYYIIDSAVDEMDNRSDGFFPIDNELLGNEGRRHNYHFSVELHATFRYEKGNTFLFRGDDDVWVYFNNQLCVDLGGAHEAQSASVSIDELVANGTLNIKEGDAVSFDMFYMERHTTESNLYMKTNINFINFDNSDWATFTIFDAYQNDLIPDCLMEADLSQPITRAEFAAVCVKACEKLSGTPALSASVNPFTDTQDIEVLKAYNLGVTQGTSETTFSPDTLLDREQAATMLTRVFQQATIPGWPQNNPPLTYTKPADFADDADISSWARDSVYFMAANKIIEGIGNNLFAPRAVTSEQQARGYAQATREQALIIATRMVLNLG